MNDNPGETPNPLNPTPEMENDLVSEPDTQPVSEPAAVEEVVETSVEVTSEPAGNTDPAARPMEQAQTSAPEPKKKKTGIIVGVVIALFLLIAGGVTAALMLLNTNKGDAVAAAIEKIMSGKAPDNSAIKGSIEFNITQKDLPFSKLSIDIDAEASTTSKVNRAEVDIVADFRNGDESVKLSLAEIYGADGNLYLKVDGVAEAISDIITRQDILDPDAASSEQFAQTIVMFGGIIGMIDGEWIRLPLDDITGLIANTDTDSDMNCLANLVNSADKNTNSLAGLYRNNPFIVSSKDNLSVASRKDPIYKISIDSEKFVNFVNASQKSEAIEEFYTCVGYENTLVSADDLVSEFNNLPEIYVEVDKDNNFTRLYIESPVTINNDCDEDWQTFAACESQNINIGTMVIDLEFSYPANINVSEPTDYEDLNTVLQNLMTSMYDIEDVEIVTE